MRAFHGTRMSFWLKPKNVRYRTELALMHLYY